MDILGSAYIKEASKYSLADFVRREGGGYLPISQKFLAQNVVRKGVEGGTRPTMEMKKTSISIVKQSHMYLSWL